MVRISEISFRRLARRVSCLCTQSCFPVVYRAQPCSRRLPNAQTLLHPKRAVNGGVGGLKMKSTPLMRIRIRLQFSSHGLLFPHMYPFAFRLKHTNRWQNVQMLSSDSGLKLRENWGQRRRSLDERERHWLLPGGMLQNCGRRWKGREQGLPRQRQRRVHAKQAKDLSRAGRGRGDG